MQECSILPHSHTYYCLLLSLCHMFIIFVISYQACTDIGVMLKHYRMSFLVTTQNGNFLLYPIMFKNQILYKAGGLHSDVQNLELQRFYDSFLIHFKYPYPGLWDLRLRFDRHLAITAFTNLPCFLLSSFSFVRVI